MCCLISRNSHHLKYFGFCCPGFRSPTHRGRVCCWGASRCFRYYKAVPAHLPCVDFQFVGSDLARLSTVVLSGGMMDALLFLSSVPSAQKLSGRGYPSLSTGRWQYSKRKSLHTTQDPWAIIVTQTFHPQVFQNSLWCLGWDTAERFCIGLCLKNTIFLMELCSSLHFFKINFLSSVIKLWILYYFS